MAYVINGMIQTSHALMDVIVSETKTILDGLILKNSELANDNETEESLEESDLFISAKDGSTRVSFFPKPLLNKYLSEMGYSTEDAKNYSEDPSTVPNSDYDKILKYCNKRYIEDYEEKNNYYRMLNGQPDYDTSEYDVYINSEEYLKRIEKANVSADFNFASPIHKFTIDQITTLDTLGILQEIIDKYYTNNTYDKKKYKYLNYIGGKAIDIYTARKAKNWDILYMPVVNKLVSYRFQELYKINRDTYDRRINQLAYSVESDHFTEMVMFMIVCQTFNDMIVDTPEWYIRRDVIDLRSVQYFLESQGVQFFADIPMKYQVRIVKGLNKLIRYKSTDKNIFDILEMFSVGKDAKVYHYYLLKNYADTMDTGDNSKYADFGSDDTEDIRNTKYTVNYDFGYEDIKEGIDQEGPGSELWDYGEITETSIEESGEEDDKNIDIGEDGEDQVVGAFKMLDLYDFLDEDSTDWIHSTGDGDGHDVPTDPETEEPNEFFDFGFITSLDDNFGNVTPEVELYDFNYEDADTVEDVKDTERHQEYKESNKIITDENGNVYELEFVKVPLGEQYDDYIKDSMQREKYDEVTRQDKYWDGTNIHSLVKNNHYKKDFTIEGTKFMGLEYNIDIQEFNLEREYYLGMIFNSKINLDTIRIGVPSIKQNAYFNLRNLFIFLYCCNGLYAGEDIDVNDPSAAVIARKDQKPDYSDSIDYDGGYVWSGDGKKPDTPVEPEPEEDEKKWELTSLDFGSEDPIEVLRHYVDCGDEDKIGNFKAKIDEIMDYADSDYFVESPYMNNEYDFDSEDDHPYTITNMKGAKVYDFGEYTGIVPITDYKNIFEFGDENSRPITEEFYNEYYGDDSDREDDFLSEDEEIENISDNNSKDRKDDDVMDVVYDFGYQNDIDYNDPYIHNYDYGEITPYSIDTEEELQKQLSEREPYFHNVDFLYEDEDVIIITKYTKVYDMGNDDAKDYIDQEDEFDEYYDFSEITNTSDDEIEEDVDYDYDPEIEYNFPYDDILNITELNYTVPIGQYYVNQRNGDLVLITVDNCKDYIGKTITIRWSWWDMEDYGDIAIDLDGHGVNDQLDDQYKLDINGGDIPYCLVTRQDLGDYIKSKHSILFKDLSGRVYGFNMNIDLQQLEDDINFRHSAFGFERAYTLKDLGCDTYIVQKEFKDLMDMYNVYMNNIKCYDTLIDLYENAETRDEKRVYSYVFYTLFTTPYDMEFYITNSGDVAETYDQVLEKYDYTLYQKYLELMSEPDPDTRIYNLRNIMNDIVDTLEYYISGDRLKYVMNFVYTNSFDSIMHYIQEMINFFKSWKVQFLNPKVNYIVNDKFNHKISYGDQIGEFKEKYWYTDSNTISDSVMTKILFLFEDEKDKYANLNRKAEVVDVAAHFVEDDLLADNDYDGGSASDDEAILDLDGGGVDDVEHSHYLIADGKQVDPRRDLYVLDGGGARPYELGRNPIDIDGGTPESVDNEFTNIVDGGYVNIRAITSPTAITRIDEYNQISTDIRISNYENNGLELKYTDNAEPPIWPMHNVDFGDDSALGKLYDYGDLNDPGDTLENIIDAFGNEDEDYTSEENATYSDPSTYDFYNQEDEFYTVDNRPSKYAKIYEFGNEDQISEVEKEVYDYDYGEITEDSIDWIESDSTISETGLFFDYTKYADSRDLENNIARTDSFANKNINYIEQLYDTLMLYTDENYLNRRIHEVYASIFNGATETIDRLSDSFYEQRILNTMDYKINSITGWFNNANPYIMREFDEDLLTFEGRNEDEELPPIDNMVEYEFGNADNLYNEYGYTDDGKVKIYDFGDEDEDEKSLKKAS